MNGMSLLDVLRDVMLDPAEQAAYSADPGAYLARHGYADVEPAHLSEAFGLVADTLPAEQAQAAWSAATVDDAAAAPDAEFTGAQPEADAAVSFGYGDSDPTDADEVDLAEAANGEADLLEADLLDGGTGSDGGTDRSDDVDHIDDGTAPRFGDPTDEVDEADTSFTDDAVDFGDVADDHDADLLVGGDEPGGEPGHALLDAASGADGGVGPDLGDDIGHDIGHDATDELGDPPPDDFDIGSF